MKSLSNLEFIEELFNERMDFTDIKFVKNRETNKIEMFLEGREVGEGSSINECIINLRLYYSDKYLKDGK